MPPMTNMQLAYERHHDRQKARDEERNLIVSYMRDAGYYQIAEQIEEKGHLLTSDELHINKDNTMTIDPKDDFILSNHANNLLIQHQQRLIRKKREELKVLEDMTALDMLANGLTRKEAPFELAGRMAKKGWESIEYSDGSDGFTQGWRVVSWGTNRRVETDEVKEMLEAEE